MAVPALTMDHIEKLDLRTIGNAAHESIHLASQQRTCSMESVPFERATIGEEGIVQQLQCRRTNYKAA